MSMTVVDVNAILGGNFSGHLPDCNEEYETDKISKAADIKDPLEDSGELNLIALSSETNKNTSENCFSKSDENVDHKNAVPQKKCEVCIK